MPSEFRQPIWYEPVCILRCIDVHDINEKPALETLITEVAKLDK